MGNSIPTPFSRKKVSKPTTSQEFTAKHDELVVERKEVSKPSTSQGIDAKHDEVVIESKEVSQPSTAQGFAATHDEVVLETIFQCLSRLPSGYRFMPTDVELIRDYLRPKIANQPLPPCFIHSVDLYHFHPKTLAENYVKHPNHEGMLFFTPRYRKYRHGSRPALNVEGTGYWKATGSDMEVTLGDELIGYTKPLVFIEGKAPAGKTTKWFMREYRTCESRKRTSDGDMKLDDWVLCKIYEREERDRSSFQRSTVDTSSNGNPVVRANGNAVTSEPEELNNKFYLSD